MLVAVLGGSLVARQQALGRSLAALPASERDSGSTGSGCRSTAALPAGGRARAQALATLGGGRASPDDLLPRAPRGRGAGRDRGGRRSGPGGAARSGRLPRTCTAAACEVLQIGGGGDGCCLEGRRAPPPRRDRRPPRSGAVRLLAADGGRREAGRPCCSAPSVDALDRLAVAEPFFRVYRGSRHSPASGCAHVADRSHPGGGVACPDGALRRRPGVSPQRPRPGSARRGLTGRRRSAAARPGRRGDQRAAARVRDHRRDRAPARAGGERRRLLARGARRWQAGLARGAEIGSMTLAGAVAGVAGGRRASCRRSPGAAGLPVAGDPGHTLFSGWTVVLLARRLARATLRARGGRPWPGTDESGRRRIHRSTSPRSAPRRRSPQPSAAAPSTRSSTSSGSTALLLVLPALVCFVAAVVLARLLGPAMRRGRAATRATGRCRSASRCSRSRALRCAPWSAARSSRSRSGSRSSPPGIAPHWLQGRRRPGRVRGSPRLHAHRGIPARPAARRGAAGPVRAAPRRGARVSRRARRRDHAGARVGGSLAHRARSSGRRRRAAAVALRLLLAVTPATIAARLAPAGEPRAAGVPCRPGRRASPSPARLRGAGLVAGLVLGGGDGRTEVLPLGRLRPGANVSPPACPAARTCACSGSSSHCPRASSSSSPTTTPRARSRRPRPGCCGSDRCAPPPARAGVAR